MGRRISEKPIRVGFQAVESGANTFQTDPIQLPTVPILQLRAGGDVKAIGVELMAIESEFGSPDPEAGQNNSVVWSITKGAAPTVPGTKNANNTILRKRRIARGVTVTSVGEIFQLYDEDAHDDMTDHDGNGELIADNEIHVAILGTGNAGAKAVTGYLLFHLYEFDSMEAMLELIETATI